MSVKQTSPAIASLTTAPGIAGRWAAVRHQISERSRELDIRNLATLGFGELACRVATLVAFVHLARTLTPAGYGLVELTLAVLMIVTLVVDQGLGTFGTREVARDSALAPGLTRRIILLQLTCAGVLLVATTLVSAFAAWSPTLKALFLGYALSLLAFPFQLQWLFQGLRQMSRAALPQVLRWVLFTALVFVLVRDGDDILMIPVSEIIAVTAGALLFLFYFSRSNGPWERRHLACTGAAGILPARDAGTNESANATSRQDACGPSAGKMPALPEVRALLKESLPIGGSNLIWATRLYLPTILLGILVTESAVGFFGTAHRVLMAVQTFVNVYFLNFLPLLTQKMHRSPEQVGEILRRSTILAGIACVLMAVVVTATARSVIGLIYGDVYAQSNSPLLLSLLIWVIPVFVLRNHARSALIAMGRQRLEMSCSLVGLIALVGGGSYLTMLYGATGAAWAMLGSEFLATALSWGAVKYHWSSLAFEF